MQWAVLTTKVDLGIGVIAAAAVDMRASLCSGRRVLPAVARRLAAVKVPMEVVDRRFLSCSTCLPASSSV